MKGSSRSPRVVNIARQDGPEPTSSGETTSSSTSSTVSSTSDPPTSHSSSTSPPITSTSTSTPPTSTSEPPPTSSTTSPTSEPPNTTSTTSTHTTFPTTTETTNTRPQVPPPTTTPSPPVSLSPTTATSSLTTVTSTLENGQTTTFTSALPTSLSSSTPSKSNQNRTAIIAGATTAGIVLILIALGAVFLYRRHQIRQQFDAYFHRPKREDRGLLDGEDFDDEEDGVPMRRYRDASSSANTTTPRSDTPNSQAPSLYRARALETGSIFREEVWPPPGRESELVDPFVDSVRRSRDVDLGSIVDAVMGPKVVATAAGAGAGHPQRSENSTAATTSSSSTAYTGLPVAQGRPDSSQSIYTDPFRDASRTAASSSVYYALPPGASPASRPGAPIGLTTNPPPSSYHLQPPPETHAKPASPPVEPGIGATRPGASSPLARALSTASSKLSVGATESKLWLDRKVRGSTEGSQP